MVWPNLRARSSVICSMVQRLECCTHSPLAYQLLCHSDE